MTIEEIQKDLLQKADGIMDDIADFIFSESQKNIHEHGTDNTGFLAKAANVNREFLRKEIVYPAPYAAYVEFGTVPHMPPVTPIEKWARKKLALSEKEARKAAWAIAKKIEKEGTDPQPFLRPAVEVAIGRYSK